MGFVVYRKLGKEKERGMIMNKRVVQGVEKKARGRRRKRT